LEVPNRLRMKDAPRITFSWVTDSHIMTYSVEESNIALNSVWNEDLLRKLIFCLKSTKFEIYPR
jgi:hypothetical protein